MIKAIILIKEYYKFLYFLQALNKMICLTPTLFDLILDLFIPLFYLSLFLLNMSYYML